MYVFWPGTELFLFKCSFDYGCVILLDLCVYVVECDGIALWSGVDPKSILCEFYKVGQCAKGFKCKFSHDVNIQRKGEKIDIYSDKRDHGLSLSLPTHPPSRCLFAFL